MHAKSGLLDTEGVLWMAVPATALSVLGGIFVQGVAGGALRIGFGAFLCILSLYQFSAGIRTMRAEGEEKGGSAENFSGR